MLSIRRYVDVLFSQSFGRVCFRFVHAGDAHWTVTECALTRPVERRFAAAGCVVAPADGRLASHLAVFGGVSFEGDWNDMTLLLTPV